MRRRYRRFVRATGVHPLRTGVLVTAAAAAIAAACWYIGMDAVHAGTIGLAVIAVAVTVLHRSEGESVPWPAEVAGEADGVRQDVVRLAWGLRPARRGVPEAGLRRVRTLASQRLAGHGLRLDRPADRPRIERLLGPRAAAVLYPAVRAPSLGEVVAALDSLDTLARPHRADPERTSA